MKTAIKVHPLAAPHTLVCPACSQPVLVAHPDHFEVPGAGADGSGAWDHSRELLLAMWDSLRDLHPSLRSQGARRTAGRGVR